MPDILEFKRPEPEKSDEEPVVSLFSVPNAVEWLERLGFEFVYRNGIFEIQYPTSLGLKLPAFVNQQDVARAIGERFGEDRAMWRAVHQFVKWRHEARMVQAQSILKGGPFDGEEIEPSKWGGTFCRQVRRGWWAIYVRKFDNYHADFQGYATSEVKGKTKQLAVKAETVTA